MKRSFSRFARALHTGQYSFSISNIAAPFCMWIVAWMGFEPTTPGITIRCSNQLSYTHQRCFPSHELVRPAGIEPATAGLEGRCSIRLSYGRPCRIVASNSTARMPRRNGRGRGIRTPDILLPKQARYQTALYPADGTRTAAFAVSRCAPARRKSRVLSGHRRAVSTHMPSMANRHD